jgi:hypothetical protein
MNARRGALFAFALILLACIMAAACNGDDGSNGKVPPPSGLDPAFAGAGPGQVLVTASGETLALRGYSFPPESANDVAFVDGWELRFERVLVTVDHLSLSENPDRSPTNQAETEGVVAQLDGPWALDLHAGGPLAGKGGGADRSIPIAVFSSQNKSAGNDAFDKAKRYAFGFDIIPATSTAKNVNLDAEAMAEYETMKRDGITTLFVGTATSKVGPSDCTSPTPYDFQKLPRVVRFRFAFATPASYLNCQNPDADPARPFQGEEHPRGVQVKGNAAVVAQVTIHTDHMFWEALAHDAPLHFDPIAAHATRADAGSAAVTLDDLAGVDFTSFKDKDGAYLPWRSCINGYSGQRGGVFYDARSTPVDPSAPPDRALRDFRDYVSYAESTMGHLNADGLCFVRRAYSSPP